MLTDKVVMITQHVLRNRYALMACCRWWNAHYNHESLEAWHELAKNKKRELVSISGFNEVRLSSLVLRYRVCVWCPFVLIWPTYESGKWCMSDMSIYRMTIRWGKKQILLVNSDATCLKCIMYSHLIHTFAFLSHIPIAAVWLPIYSVASLTWVNSLSVYISSPGRHNAKHVACIVQQSLRVACGIHLWSHYIT